MRRLLLGRCSRRPATQIVRCETVSADQSDLVAAVRRARDAVAIMEGRDGAQSRLLFLAGPLRLG